MNQDGYQPEFKLPKITDPAFLNWVRETLDNTENIILESNTEVFQYESIICNVNKLLYQMSKHCEPIRLEPVFFETPCLESGNWFTGKRNWYLALIHQAGRDVEESESLTNGCLKLGVMIYTVPLIRKKSTLQHYFLLEYKNMKHNPIAYKKCVQQIPALLNGYKEHIIRELAQSARS
jgi:hypothetical protein